MIDTASAASGAGTSAASTSAASTTASTAAQATGQTGGMIDAAAAPSTAPFQATNGAGNTFNATSTAAGKSIMFDAYKPTASGTGLLGSIEAYPGSIDAAANAAGSVSADPTIWGQAQAWAKANPELAKMALNGIGTAAGNLIPSEKDKAMMAAYKAQADATNRRALWGSGRI